MNQKASLRAGVQATASLPNPKGPDTDHIDDTIFGELVVHYRKLARRAEDIVVHQICSEVESGLKAHLSSSASTQETPEDLAVSQTLLPSLGLLSTHLTYLRAALAQNMLTTIYRRIVSRLSEHILQREILYRGNITLREGKTVHAECELWIETCQSALAGSLRGGLNRVEAPWLRLLEAGRLIAAEGELWDKVVETTFGKSNDEEWERVVGVTEMSREEVSRLLRRRQN